ncbi:MAG: family 78 glycoside hydrolase catalytic domain [Victivallales bacterium]|nr:family 78 glycoside hydrolase catalytic domain [Victivallales bacterium]
MIKELFTESTWIWTSPEDCGKDIYRRFRKDFQVFPEQISPACIAVAADTACEIYLNGKRIPLSLFSDFPDRKTYSVCAVAEYLHSGSNHVEILVHFSGEDFSTSIAGKPGLKILIEAGGTTLVKSDSSWECASDPAYFSGLCVKRSLQVGYTFGYDARNEDAFTWAKVVELPADNKFYPELPAKRPLPLLNEKAPVAGKIIQCGYLQRKQESESFAISCMKDWLRSVLPLRFFPVSGETILPDLPADANGWYLIFDLGKERTGYLSLKLNACAGTVIDIAHGEHLQDGRVRAAVGDRNFADRYICRKGMNDFTYTLLRIGARYLELHITGTVKPVKIDFTGIIPVEFPLPETETFSAPDGELMRLHATALHTMKLCMHEHYEDCPWREQALYAYDSRNQALFGYYAWGNYDFARTSLELLGQSLRSDGLLELCAPATVPITIPIFSFTWITALREYVLYSGNIDFFIREEAIVNAVLGAALKIPGGNGLFNPPEGNHIWNFYEWTEMLDGRNCDDFPQALYNLYLVEALNSAAELSGYAEPVQASEWGKISEELGITVEKYFRHEKKVSYTQLSPHEFPEQKLCEHVQALMLCLKLVPDFRKNDIIDSLYGELPIQATFSAYPYLIKALMEGNAESRRLAEQHWRDDFIPMLYSGYTTLWESSIPSATGGWSMCHAWSAVSVFACGAYHLGVTPLKPGFRKFQVKPYPGRLPAANGKIPTPYGFIEISWQWDGKVVRLQLTAPKETDPVISEYPEFPVKFNRNLIK